MITNPILLPLTISPATVAEDAGTTTFTLTVTEHDGKGFDARSVPKFNGVLPAAVVTTVSRRALTVALDPAALGDGTFGVSVVDVDRGDVLARGATLVITEAEE